MTDSFFKIWYRYWQVNNPSRKKSRCGAPKLLLRFAKTQRHSPENTVRFLLTLGGAQDWINCKPPHEHPKPQCLHPWLELLHVRPSTLSARAIVQHDFLRIALCRKSFLGWTLNEPRCGFLRLPVTIFRSSPQFLCNSHLKTCFAAFPSRLSRTNTSTTSPSWSMAAINNSVSRGS